MRVVLYIGHHKAGSTALQSFCAQGYPELLAQGILYPATEPQGLAHNLRALRDRRGPSGRLPLNLREPHNALAFRMLAEEKILSVPPFHPGLPDSATMLDILARQAEVLQPEVMLLVSEVLSNAGATKNGIAARLADFLHGHEVTVVATLRRPDHYLVSWQGQRLKFGHRLHALREAGLGQYTGTIHFDYRRMLSPWHDAFPDAEWIVQDYARVRADGGAVHNFAARTGLPLPAHLLYEPQANPSFPHSLHELVRRANHALAKPVAEDLRARVLAAVPGLDLVPNARIEMFGPQMRARMTRLFRPQLGALAALSHGEVCYDAGAIGTVLEMPEIEAYRRDLPRLVAALVEGPRALPQEISDFLLAESDRI